MNLSFVTIAATHRWPRSRRCSGSGLDESRRITSRYAVPPTYPGSTTIPCGLLKQPDKHESPLRLGALGALNQLFSILACLLNTKIGSSTFVMGKRVGSGL